MPVPLVRLAWRSLVRGQAAGIGLIDQIGQWAGSMFDTFLVEHDDDGNHTADDISKGGAFVDFTGGVYVLVQKYGYVSGVETAPSSGANVRITFSTAFLNLNYGVLPTVHFDGTIFPTIIDESTVDFDLSADGDFNFHMKGI